jgi:hypothetical protein
MSEASAAAASPGRSLRRGDFGLIEALAFLLVRQNIATWAKSWALAAGVALPAIPLFKYNYLLFGTVLVILLWVKLRGESWESFGLIEPKSWLRTLGLGLLLFVFIVLYSGTAAPAVSKAVVDLTGASPNLAGDYFASMKGNLPLFLWLLPLTWLFAAFGEEVFFRGYLMTRFAQFMGEGRVAWVIALFAQAVIFGAAHSYQGPVGMVGTGILGLISGAATLLWRRNLWPAMIAHGLSDTLGFTLIYLGQYGDGA